VNKIDNYNYQKHYRKTHKDKIAEQKKLWQKTHPEKVKSANQKYYKKHKKQIIAGVARWQKTHPEQRKQYLLTHYRKALMKEERLNALQAQVEELARRIEALENIPVVSCPDLGESTEFKHVIHFPLETSEEDKKKVLEKFHSCFDGEGGKVK
jgi:exopolyphosphatase/pppGpp-phosphohydrolase